jgi:hypothetical protein
MNVAKIDRDVAYVAMVVHLCCKLLFPLFHLFFQTYVASVFIWKLHMFHAYVANILSGCCVRVAEVFKCFMCFSQVFQTHVSNVSCVFRRMLQMFHLNIAKVDRVLHMLQWHLWLADNALPQLRKASAPISRLPREALLPSLSFPPSRRGSSSLARNPTRRACEHSRRWWPQVGRQRCDTRVVAPEQVDVRVVRSLRAGNKQTHASIWALVTPFSLSLLGGGEER